MTARSLLLALPLALAVPVNAAPAPFQRAEAAHPEVVLRGWIHDANVAACAPTFITRQSDYESVAKAWGIANPPRVDFRTHFLFVHVSRGYGGDVNPALDRGDLKAAAPQPQPVMRECEVGFRVAGFRYLIKSYRRSEVRSVNGVALPKS